MSEVAETKANGEHVTEVDARAKSPLFVSDSTPWDPVEQAAQIGRKVREALFPDQKHQMPMSPMADI